MPFANHSHLFTPSSCDKFIFRKLMKLRILINQPWFHRDVQLQQSSIHLSQRKKRKKKRNVVDWKNLFSIERNKHRTVCSNKQPTRKKWEKEETRSHIRVNGTNIPRLDACLCIFVWTTSNERGGHSLFPFIMAEKLAAGVENHFNFVRRQFVSSRVNA